MTDKTSKHTVRNTAAGPRGLNAVTGYVELAPGQTLENVELTDAEHDSAERSGHFAFDKTAKAAAKADEKAASGDALPNNPMQLKKIARDEGIDVGGATSGADLQAAILKGREAKAAAGGGAPTPPTDDLDNMDDPTLLATAAAITGKPVSDLDGKDRTELLKLARGQE